MRPGRTAAPGHTRFAATWAISSAIIFLLMLGWALATPLGAAPDEPTQIVKAAAVVRGELRGQPVAGAQRAFRVVTVPEAFADVNVAACFAGKEEVPAGCEGKIPASGVTVRATTYVGLYPPLYYAIAGLPTLVWSSGSAIYLMRALSALVAALLYGLTLALIARWSRAPLLVSALGLALTPLIVFLGGVVNPSTLEIAAATATWTAGLLLVLDHADQPPPGLLAAFVVCGSVLELVRGLSLLWMALIVLTLLAVAPKAFWRLIRQRVVQIGGAVMAVVAVVAAAYVVVAGALSITSSGQPLPAHTSKASALVLFAKDNPTYARQAVGIFGWLDTPSPLLVFLLAGLAFLVLFLLALATARPRQSLVLLALMAVAFLVPAAIVVPHAVRTLTIDWQARDGLPLYVGIPLLAGSIAGRRRPLPPAVVRGMTVGFVSVIVVVQAVDYFWALRRYTVGTYGGLDPFRHVQGGWTPPVPVAVLLAGFAVVTLVYGWWLVHVGDGIEHGNGPRPGPSPSRQSAQGCLAPPEPAGPGGRRLPTEPGGGEFLLGWYRTT